MRYEKIIKSEACQEKKKLYIGPSKGSIKQIIPICKNVLGSNKMRHFMPLRPLKIRSMAAMKRNKKGGVIDVVKMGVPLAYQAQKRAGPSFVCVCKTYLDRIS